MAGANDPGRKDEEAANAEDQVQVNGNGIHDELSESEEDENGSNDGDDRDVDHGGYELLAQEPPPHHQNGNESDHSNENEDDDIEIEEDWPPEGMIPRLPPSFQVEGIIEEARRARVVEQARETEAIFSQPRPAAEGSATSSSTAGTIDLDKDRVEQIRSAMSSFQLPSTSIPQWASELSDEEWRRMLNEKLSLDKK